MKVTNQVFIDILQNIHEVILLHKKKLSHLQENFDDPNQITYRIQTHDYSRFMILFKHEWELPKADDNFLNEVLSEFKERFPSSVNNEFYETQKSLDRFFGRDV